MSHTTAEPNENLATSPPSPEGRLRGHMGTFELAFTALAFNAPLVVVAGFVPVFAGVGNGLGAPVAVLAVGALVLVFSAGLNAMATRMVRPGAFYAYIARGLGRPPGLAAAFLAILTYIALGAGTFTLLSVVVGDFSVTVLGSSPSGGIPWWVWTLLAWAVVTTLSLFNVEVSAKVLSVAMVCEIAIVAIWNLRVFWEGGPDGRAVPVFSHLFDGNVALGFLFIATCMTGFESLQVFREETRDPVRTVPRATYIVVAFLAVFYALSTYAYIVSEGFSQGLANGAENPTGTLLASLGRYAGSVVTDAASLLLISSSFASTLAVQNIASRYIYALGRDRVVPSKLGEVSKRHGSPMVASTVSGLLILSAILIPMLAGADPIKAYTVLLGVGGYGILLLWVATSVSVFVFFRRHKGEDVGIWSSAIAPIVALLGLAAVFWLATINLGVLVGDVALAGIILVFAGAVAVAGAALALRWRRTDPTVYASIGGQMD